MPSPVRVVAARISRPAATKAATTSRMIATFTAAPSHRSVAPQAARAALAALAASLA